MDPILRQLCEQAQINLSDDQTELTEDQTKKLKEWISSTSEAASKVPDLEKRLSELEDPDKARARSLAEAGFVDEARDLAEYRADRMVKNLGEHVPEGKRLSPAAEKVARAYSLDQTSENLDELHKMLLSEAATVDLRELGGGPDPEGDEGNDIVGKALEESGKIAKEKGISLGEAMSEYFQKNPGDWNEYQRSMGAPQGVRMEEGGR
jgi:hypothetical protein